MTEYTINIPEWAATSRNNFVHPLAFVGENVEMGSGNYIGPFCIVGHKAEHKKFWDKPAGKVILGDNNVLTGLVTIDGGTDNETVIGDNCWFLKHSHIGHDCLIGDEVTISCGAKVGGHNIIHPKCNLGLNSTIHQWSEIPEGCMIGMGSVVTKKTELQPFRKYAGVPARDIGPNKIK